MKTGSCEGPALPLPLEDSPTEDGTVMGVLGSLQMGQGVAGDGMDVLKMAYHQLRLCNPEG